MKEKIVLLLFLPFALMGQDYVVDEIFEPDNFSAKITEVSPKNRVIYSWGWNMNNDQSDLIKEFQSNYFDVRYQYNITLTKKLSDCSTYFRKRRGLESKGGMGKVSTILLVRGWHF